MRNLTEANIPEAVIRQFENTANPRLKELFSGLIRHLLS